MNIAEFISLSFKEKYELHVLNLSHNDFYELRTKDIENLCAALRQCGNLKTLKLSDTDIFNTPAALDRILISINACNLEELILQDNDLVNANYNLVTLGNFVNAAPNLIKLDISGCNLGSEIDCDEDTDNSDAEEEISPFCLLFDAICKHKTLQYLDLSRNLLSELTADISSFLFRSLMDNRSLRHIELRDNFDKKSAQHWKSITVAKPYTQIYLDDDIYTIKAFVDPSNRDFYNKLCTYSYREFCMKLQSPFTTIEEENDVTTHTATFPVSYVHL